MKQKSIIQQNALLLISIAVLTIALVVGNHQIAAAASSQNHDQTAFAEADLIAYRWEAASQYYVSNQVWPAKDLTSLSAADISAYRWEAMANYYASNQALPTKDLTSLSAADISAYRWEAMANYYASSQVSPAKDLKILNAADISAYRLILVEPGFWARQTFLSR